MLLIDKYLNVIYMGYNLKDKLHDITVDLQMYM